MLDLPLEFWTGAMELLLGGIGLYLAEKADVRLQEIYQQVKAVKRILNAQHV
jgi:hypothetical protein